MSTNPKPTKARPQLFPSDFGPHWNAVYYDIIQEYYWDPRVLGRVPANPAIFANESEMLGSLRRMEVSLNHMLALFFGLAPQDYIRRLETESFGDSTDEIYHNVNLFELRRTAPHDPTQPDVFLTSADTCFSVEVKIGAKSSLDQLVKYALLHRDHERRTGGNLKSRLMYLTPRPVSKTWGENFADVGNMRTALEDFDYPALLKKARASESLSAEDLKSAALSMEVVHMTFDHFNEFTRAYAGSISSDTPYADTARKLFDGILHEFEFRRDLLNLSAEEP